MMRKISDMYLGRSVAWLVLLILIIRISAGNNEINNNVRFTYINNVFMTDDNGVNQIRTAALTEWAFLMHLVEDLNQFRKDFNYGFEFELSEFRNHTTRLNIYVMEHLYFSRGKDQIDFLIGPDSFDDLDAIRGVNRFLKTTVFTGATFSGLDFISKVSDFVRFVPSDTYRMFLLVDVIEHFGWNYLTAFSSAGACSEELSNFDAVIKEKKRSVLIFKKFISHETSERDVCTTVENIAGKKSNRVLLFFTTASDARLILKCMRQLKLYNRFNIVFFYGSLEDPDVFEGNERLLDGAIGLNNDVEEETDKFVDYFTALNPKLQPDNVLLKLWWERAFNCSARKNRNPDGYSRNCTFDEKLTRNHMFLSTKTNQLLRSLNVASAFVHMQLHMFCRNYSNSGRCDDSVYDANSFRLYKRITSATKQELPDDNFYSFSKFIKYYVTNAHYDNQTERLEVDYAGLWKVRYEAGKSPKHIVNETTPTLLMFEFWWGNHLGKRPPSGRCSEPCQPGYLYTYDHASEDKYFCWKCIPCSDNQIVANSTTCVQCRDTEKADSTHLKCLPIVPKNIVASHTSMMHGLWVLLSLCCVLVLTVIIIVLCSKKLSMFNASGRISWLAILTGIVLCLFGSASFTLPASKYVCYFQLCVPTLGLALCHGALCVKAVRIQHSFVGVASFIHRALGENPCEKLVAVAGILQSIMVAAVVVNVDNDVLVTERLSSKDYVSQHCATGTSPILFVVYIIVVMVCMYEAYQIMHYPQNHRETLDIAFTALLSCLLMLGGITGYFIRFKDPYAMELLMAWFFALNGIVTFFGLFSKKIYLLFHQHFGRSSAEDRDSPRFRTFSANIGKVTNNIADIKSIVDSHVTKPLQLPIMPAHENSDCVDDDNFIAGEEHIYEHVYGIDYLVHRTPLVHSADYSGFDDDEKKRNDETEI